MTVTADSPIFRGHRVEHHWTELLDADDNLIRTLDGVSDGTVKGNIDAPIRGGFQFSVKGEQGIDWMRDRFRPWVMVNGQAWPLGVFLPSSPELGRDPTTTVNYSVSAHDKTIILEQDIIVETFSVAAGVEVVPQVVALIQSTGETRIAVTESSAVTRTAMTWPVATTKRQIVNELLTHVNYDLLWVDGYGQFRVEPYVEPADRPPAATFREGDLSIHAPEWSRSQDIANVPNRVVLKTAGTDDQEEMIAVEDNTDPTSPYSYQARGDRWVARPYDVDAADQVTLDALARRYLSNATRAVANISLEHAVVPLRAGDTVRFASGPIDTLAVVNEFSIKMAPGARVSATWTEVAA